MSASGTTQGARASGIQRLRVPLGFAVGALYLWLAPLSPALSWTTIILGAALAAVGLLIRGWAAGHIMKNNRLATTGPYAHTRNPLYFGSFLLAAGMAVAAHWALLVAVAAFWLLVYVPVMEKEKTHVRGMFTDAYDEWARHVPMFLPRLTPWRGADGGAAEPFSLALYLRHREWQAAVGAAAVLAWLSVRYALRG